MTVVVRDRKNLQRIIHSLVDITDNVNYNIYYNINIGEEDN